LISIIAIEAAILLPSLSNYERDLLARVRGATVAALATGSALGGLDPTADAQALAQRMSTHSPLLGGALYGLDGAMLAEFGEPPVSGYAALQQASKSQRRVADGTRFEFLWPPSESGLPYAITARAETGWLGAELTNFVLRVGGLVIVISLFVTIVAALIVGRSVLTPMLRLREQLIAAAADPDNPERYASAGHRADEFGEVVQHVNSLLTIIATARRAAIARVVAMTDNSLDGIVAIDDADTVVYVNQAAQRFFERAKVETAAVLTLPATAEVGGEAVSFVDIVKKAPFADELTLTLPSGQQRTVMCSANRLTDETLGTDIYYASFRDVTTRRQAEDALRESETRFRTLFEQSSEPILVIDPDSRTILDANGKVAALLERTVPSLLAPVAADDGPFEEPGFSAFIQNVIVAGGGRTDSLTCRASSGLSIPVDLSASAVEIDGRRVVLAHMRDLTECKRIERAQEEATAEAERANKAKTQFLANMSHELRTPLNAILGFAEMLQLESFGPLGSEKYVHYAADIHDSGQHLLKIVSDILDLSKIEAGRYTLDERPVDLASVAEACRRIVAEQAQASGLEIAVAIPSAFPALRADERVCRQILLNLLANSIKFTPPGGRIAVGAGVETGSALWLSVADTGIGIAEEQLPSVLEPFTQVDGSLARQSEGTGLGLSLVHSFARLHDGDITITSTLGQGTTVVITFPASRIMTMPLGAAGVAAE
jgi:signal transduction histidine kinase